LYFSAVENKFTVSLLDYSGYALYKGESSSAGKLRMNIFMAKFNKKIKKVALFAG